MDTEKLDLQSPDLVNANVEKLATLFPHCVTETAEGKAIDFDLLRQELSHQVVEGAKERYRLEWPGKREAIVTANLPTTNTLRPVRADSVDFDNTQNLYIEGDNLEVLKLLQESYLGKIKMIYIDPPYNTGKDFVYKDNFAKDAQAELFESGQKDEYNQRLMVNPETAGRYHSDWLSMMYPRLKLARNLLTEDGVIFISIDDNEVHNLRKVCDEVFGEGNFVSELIWERAYSPKNDAKFISNSHDYILMYSKSIGNFKIGRLERTDAANSRYSNPDNDPRGVWKSSDISVKTYNSENDYPITTPSGRIVEPPAGRCWRLSKKAFFERLQDNRIWFGTDGNSVPSIKRFLTELKFEGMAPTSILFYKEVGHSQEGAQEVVKLFEGNGSFDGPKPVRLLSRILTLANLNEESIVLDFFSGSATTAHAMMQLNAEDGGNRKFIMVQLPEATDSTSEAYKAGYKNICEIGKERIRRAGKKIVNDQLSMVNEKKAQVEKQINGQLLMVNGQWVFPEERIVDEKAEDLLKEINHLQLTINHLDTGFRVYRLDESNMQDVYYRPQDYRQATLELFADNIKPDRTADDLLAQVMLDWGLPLSLKIAQVNIAGKKVFKVAGDSLYACFDTGIDETFAKEIAKDKPMRVVFRDKGFKDDTAKVNVKQLLKQLSPETEMKVI
ncbi:MAG: site-specific DNA-methyltransferase [Bacteroidia bacterium]|nr:site-specific DNA-methyltransferase [Bacteroidia bacterium]